VTTVPCLLDVPVNELAGEEFPGDVVPESPAEMAYVLAYIKVRMQDAETSEESALYLYLMRLVPCSLSHYRERAETARWRRLDRKWRARQQFSVGAR
jgi:hypothetical protein